MFVWLIWLRGVWECFVFCKVCQTSKTTCSSALNSTPPPRRCLWLHNQLYHCNHKIMYSFSLNHYLNMHVLKCAYTHMVILVWSKSVLNSSSCVVSAHPTQSVQVVCYCCCLGGVFSTKSMFYSDGGKWAGTSAELVTPELLVTDC